jgi:hypothetical protein
VTDASGASGARRSLARRAVDRLRRTLWSTEEFRVYRMSASRARAHASSSALLAVDARDALAHYAPDNAWDPPPARFAAVAAARRADGHHVFTLVEHGVLVHHSWLDPQATRVVSDFGQEYVLPPGSAVLYDDNTHSSARGRGLHKRSLAERLQAAAARPDVRWIYIGVLGSNWPSRRNIEGAGFDYQISFFRARRAGLVRLSSAVTR